MNYKPLPSMELITELFDYNAETGVVIRKKTTSGNSKKGAIVGCLQGTKGKEYLTVGIGNQLYKLHRIIWKLMTGEDPGQMTVDHRDRNRTNNVWANLQLATAQNNSQNRGPNNGKQYKGVRQRANGSWWAGIQYQKKRIHLGYFKTKEEAALAYNAASRELHGEWGYQNPITPQ